MTIKDYFSNYKSTCILHDPIPEGKSSSIDDLYDVCIAPYTLDKDYVLKWHEMLMQYADRDDAVLWIRYYESGNKKSGRWNTRRAAVTQFSDGFSYVFVSNFDVHEIWNMIRLHVEPDIELFAEMMKNRTYPLHYDGGKSCEELDIAAFPRIGNTRAGILTYSHRYLAHICGIKSEIFSPSGQCIKIDVKTDPGRYIFPRGDLSDWSSPTPDLPPVRTLNYSLSQDEKNLVKAHFLRFTDPLNYYVVPGKSFEINNTGVRIGEYPPLNFYMQEKFKALYGKTAWAQFCEKAMIPPAPSLVPATASFTIEYGEKLKKKKSFVRKDPFSQKGRPGTVAHIVKTKIVPILENRQLSQEEIAVLLTKEGSRSAFGLSGFAALTISINEKTKNRYYKKPIMIHTQKYYLCSQWRDKSIPLLEKWAKEHDLSRSQG